MQFTGPDRALEQAIEADDAHAVDAALAAGANANAHGAHGVTPLEYAVGTFRKGAVRALLRHKADPNRKDAEGDNAVTVAVDAYGRDPELLALVLAAGGDPNSVGADGAPAITSLLSTRHWDGATLLHQQGANLDTDYREQPMVVAYAWSVDWDIVQFLIRQGARTDLPRARDGLVAAFGVPGATPPDSPLYPAKVAVWRHLKAQGLNPTPPAGM